MADNSTTSPGGGGDTFRTLEQSGGPKWPADVAAFATTISAGANVLQVVTPTTGLPVRLADASGYLATLPVSLASVPTHAVTQSGTWNVGAIANPVALDSSQLEDAPAADGAAGTFVLTVRQDAPAASTSADGDFQSFKTDSAGRLWVAGGNANASAASSHSLQVAGSDGTNTRTLLTDNTGKLQVTATALVSGTVDTELPAAAAVSADNVAAPTAPTIYSFGMAFDGTNWDRLRGDSADGLLVNLGANNDVTVTSGTVSVSGSVAVDSELPAAVTLADNLANPTAPAVGSHSLLWDTTQWVRARGDTANGLDVDVTRLPALAAGTNNIGDVDVLTLPNVTLAAGTNTNEVVGDAAHDAAVAGNPLRIGARAETALSGITLVADGDTTDLYAGVDGVLITRPHTNLEDVVQERATNTDGASTAFVSGLAAPGAGVRLWVTGVTLCNTSGTMVTVDLRDGTAGGVLWTFPVPANGGVTHQFNPPLRLTANTALAYDASAATTTLTVSANGFRSKV